MDSLKKLRLEADMTQQELSVLSGVSQVTISLIERGTSPNLTTAMKLASALGVSLETLVSGVENGASQ